MTAAGRDGPGGVLAQIEATLTSRGLRLRRSWPRDEEHLLLEAVGSQGTVAGQWFAEAVRAARVADQTPGANRVGQVVLQPAGADRRLRFLRNYAGLPTAVLVAHRPERRAVVRLGTEPRTRYTKLVRRDRVPALADAARVAATLPVPTPRVLAVDEPHGSVTTAALAGVALHELLGTPAAVDACIAAGVALARIHAAPVPVGLSRHGLAEERAVRDHWRGLAARYGLALPGVPTDLEVPAEAADAAAPTLIHRDFHDKQVVIGPDGRAGVLDFDLMAVGDPMLDLGNLLAHLYLRAAQGLILQPGRVRVAVLQGYQPTSAQLRRLPTYERLAADRLAAVYAFRPPDLVT